MNLKDLEAIIKTKLNYRYDSDTKRWDYDGLDMSGFNSSSYTNMEIISRFAAYMVPWKGDETRCHIFFTTHFWKGAGSIIRVNDESSELVEDVEGDATCTIIRKLILHQNPSIITPKRL